MDVACYAVDGDLDSADIQGFEQDAPLVERLQSGPTIIDVRRAEFENTSIASLYFLADRWAQLNIRNRIALLVKNRCSRTEFFETCCLNQGLPLRAFTAGDQAAQWLRARESA